MSPQLLRVVERAQREPQGRFHSLAHLIDVPALKRAFGRIRKDGAVGVDGVTKEEYGQDLEGNLEDLHGRLKSMRYRHQPIRRVHIPKAKGKTRPIGISAFEDKIVQDAVRGVLEAIYEQDFLDCSFGFRPERSAHDALRALDRMAHRGKVSCILEADIQSFLRQRGSHQAAGDAPDSGSRWIAAAVDRQVFARGGAGRRGVLRAGPRHRPRVGALTASGDVCLHYVLDVWFAQEVQPRLRGRATLIRYADDFTIGFERHDDAQRVMAVLGKRFERFGLTLHPDKTRLVPFRRPPAWQRGGKGPATFDFLGFTLYWGRTRRGRWMMWCKTRQASFRRAKRSIAEWCRRYRHLPVGEQHAALTRRLRGHFNYFGVSGNFRSLLLLVESAKWSWFKWLRRRSQRTRLTWQRFDSMLERYPLPRPRVTVRIWGP